MKKLKIIGKNKSWTSLIKSIKVASYYSGHILLEGATGTGKNILARYIFENSKSFTESYMLIDCSALNHDTAEMVLFGACPNSYSGIDSAIEGLVDFSDNGTLFFDNIGSLSPDLQGKLLRFIEYGEYLPLGGRIVNRINVRIIASTSSILNNINSCRDLRSDLYHRFSQFKFFLPPLSQRRDDIELYLNFFLGEYSNVYFFKKPVLSRELLLSLAEYSWPGNIRQLENLCHYFVISKFRRPIELADLPADLVLAYHTKVKNKHMFILPKRGLDLVLLRQNFIRQALLRASNVTHAAELLGISRRKLEYISNKLTHV